MKYWKKDIKMKKFRRAKPLVNFHCVKCSEKTGLQIESKVPLNLVFHRQESDSSGFKMTHYYTNCPVCQIELRVRLDTYASKCYWRKQ